MIHQRLLFKLLRQLEYLNRGIKEPTKCGFNFQMKNTDQIKFTYDFLEQILEI